MSDKIETKPKTWGRPFAKGQSGNPNGRPAMPPEIRAKLKANAPRVVKAWLDALRATTNGKPDGPPDHDIRLKAADRIAERIWGKPTQAITGADGEPLFGDGTALLALLERLANPAAMAMLDAEANELPSLPEPPEPEGGDGS